VMTPLLFAVCSGALDARHCSFPIRAFLRTTRFVEAKGQGVFRPADLKISLESEEVEPRREAAFAQSVSGPSGGVQRCGHRQPSSHNWRQHMKTNDRNQRRCESAGRRRAADIVALSRNGVERLHAQDESTSQRNVRWNSRAGSSPNANGGPR
jgi:hypothetical protein